MSARGIAPPLAPADLLERVRRALHDAPAGRPFVATIPAPAVDPVAFLSSGDDCFFWTDRDGRVLAARGSAVRLRADGDSRFVVLGDLARNLAASLNPTTPPARLVGGAAFMPGRAPDDGWHAFDDASFDLPRVAVFDDASGERWLQLALAAGADPDALALEVAQLVGTAAPDPAPVRLRGDIAIGNAEWNDVASAALAAIGGGEVNKIVIARSAGFQLDAPLDATTLVPALARAEGAYRFVIRRDDVVFAGATPERLIQRDGEHVRTEAVAGTGSFDDAVPLAERDKDQREHLAVVLAIDEVLAAVSLALEHATEPLVRRHGAITHLVTPFEGRLAPETHVLDVVDQLHPTPAVAGTPRAPALDFIARYEPTARGWYAGPIGWFDLHGDGELAVALRCVRIEGTALVAYAGAGIVEGSDPDAEFAETVLKMNAALSAIGASLRR